MGLAPQCHPLQLQIWAGGNQLQQEHSPAAPPLLCLGPWQHIRQLKVWGCPVASCHLGSTPSLGLKFSSMSLRTGPCAFLAHSVHSHSVHFHRLDYIHSKQATSLASLLTSSLWHQEIACLNSQRTFQFIKQMEWKEALISANAYKRVAKEMETHMPWGAREQTAIGQVIPHLNKHTYMHWEEDIKGNKIGWEVKDHPQKQKKCAKCWKTRHFCHNCPLRTAN